MSGSGVCSKTQKFFVSASHERFVFALGLYDECIKLKAHSKSQKPENIIKLDKWYQNELPRRLKARGKDVHLTHEELVQTIKWKLARGKFRPNLTNLVQMNTPRVVVSETKKAFRNLFKRRDLNAATSALCNLKGVGPATASAVLAAGAPDTAPFMADECLLSMPDVESLDYTMKEYMRFVEHINAAVERLNQQAGNDFWTPHKVELAVWSHYVANDLKPELLEQMPTSKVSNHEKEGEKEKDVENGTEDTVNGENKDNGKIDEVNSEEEKRSNEDNGTKSDDVEQIKNDEDENSEEKADKKSATDNGRIDDDGESRNVKGDDKDQREEDEQVENDRAANDKKDENGRTENIVSNNGREDAATVDGTKNGHKEEGSNGSASSEVENGSSKDENVNNVTDQSIETHKEMSPVVSTEEPVSKKARLESTNEETIPKSHVESTTSSSMTSSSS